MIQPRRGPGKNLLKNRVLLPIKHFEGIEEGFKKNKKKEPGG